LAASAVAKKADEIKEQAGEAAEEFGKKANAAKDQAVDSAISTLENLRSERHERSDRYERSERPQREPRRYAVNDEAVQAAREFLQKVFNAMKIDVVMEKFISKNDGSVTFRLHGDDMGILIGKHGQTLDSLQYLTNLVANKNSSERVRVIIDVEDYRDRRIETLTRLANRLADKVKRTGERVALEPMNPHERKIIHMALQGDRRVTTLSEGDDPYRHVVIELKR
jgi:spoIIIJ-associated protein